MKKPEVFGVFKRSPEKGSLQMDRYLEDKTLSVPQQTVAH
jgi:hypothetical protein